MFNTYALCRHFPEGFLMPFMVYICKTVIEQMYLESGLQQIFACVADAVLGSNSADKYVRDVKQFKYLTKRLPGVVQSLET